MDQSRVDPRTMLFGLIFRCPLGGNPADCQGHAIRELPIEDRIAWLDGLSDEECSQVYARHLDCLAQKEGDS